MMLKSNYDNLFNGVGGGAKGGATVGVSKRIPN